LGRQGDDRCCRRGRRSVLFKVTFAETGPFGERFDLFEVSDEAIELCKVFGFEVFFPCLEEEVEGVDQMIQLGVNLWCGAGAEFGYSFEDDRLAGGGLEVWCLTLFDIGEGRAERTMFG